MRRIAFGQTFTGTVPGPVNNTVGPRPDPFPLPHESESSEDESS